MENGIDFFVDTNFLIYLLEEHPVALNIAKHSFRYGISVITEIELLGKKNITPNEEYAIRNLLNDCEIIDLSNDIKEIAISIRQKYSIKSFDAIIAATAKSLNMQLVTADKDFTKIKEIDVVLLDLNL
jgi:predicted nucleic acid-binding protein